MTKNKEHLVNISLGLLISKVDRGELEISEAIGRAYKLGRDSDEEPPTVRYLKVVSNTTFNKQ